MRELDSPKGKQRYLGQHLKRVLWDSSVGICRAVRSRWWEGEDKDDNGITGRIAGLSDPTVGALGVIKRKSETQLYHRPELERCLVEAISVLGEHTTDNFLVEYLEHKLHEFRQLAAPTQSPQVGDVVMFRNNSYVITAVDRSGASPRYSIEPVKE